jgi:uncharacterized protein YutD
VERGGNQTAPERLALGTFPMAAGGRMSDIQDEAYSEAMDEIARKDAEIKRLKAVIEDLSDHGCAAERMERLKAQSAEIKRLRKVVEAQVERLDYLEARHANEFNLLVRADDALSKWNVRNRFSDLIDELRKAAE